MKKTKFATVFVLAIFMGAMITPVKKFRANLSLTDYKNQIAFLQTHQFDIAGVNYTQKSVQVLVNESQLNFLKAQGFKPEVALRIESLDNEYKNPDEIQTLLKDYNARFPSITKLVSIGKSGEGRDIWALKISDNPNEHEAGEPAVLFNGMHHAREVMTPEIPLDIIESLLTGYSNNETITRWVNSYEVWLVPMLNVDGSNKVWKEDSWWRKNTHGGYGVDINRNYPYGWGTCRGSSGNKNTDDYRGENPGSEPETKALMGLVNEIRPVFDISFHSYGELVLYPYGCDGKHVETATVVEAIGQKMASLIPSDSSGNYTPGVPWEILYGVDGDDISWMYHDYQVIPFVIEMNQDFQPEYSTHRDATVKKLRAAWNLLFERLEGPGFYGQVIDSQSLPVNNANLKITGDKFNQSYKVNPDGTFFVILNPGEYKLVIETPQKTTEAVMFEIGNSPLKKTIEL